MILSFFISVPYYLIIVLKVLHDFKNSSKGKWITEHGPFFSPHIVHIRTGLLLFFIWKYEEILGDTPKFRKLFAEIWWDF